jgi:O-methyltransferase involved in polyketide biosynthesis
VGRYGLGLTYVEADLPDMAARKRAALEQMGSLGDEHRVVALDALSADGLDRVAAELDPEGGLAIITEGLLGYIPTPAVTGLWERIARALERFERGRYISDLHLGGVQTPSVRAFRVALSAFVRGRVQLHFENAQEAEQALLTAGFGAAHVRKATDLVGGPPPRDAGASLVRIIEASTT